MSEKIKKTRDELANWENWPLELEEKAKQHKAESYFWIGYSPNFFDSIRIALYQHREKNLSVLTGCDFKFSWLNEPKGVIKTYDKNEQAFGHACFHPNTKILTKKGYKPINEIKRGELVLTH